MLAVIGAIVGALIELATPWSDIIMLQFEAVLADPSISGNPQLSFMITACGIFAAYIFLPLFGATGGFFTDSSA